MPKILLVDDDQASNEIIHSTFANAWGWDMKVAKNAREAFSLLEGEVFDVIVADQNLGPRGPSGVEVLEFARDRSRAHVFALVSGIIDLDGLPAWIGANCLLITKPYAINQLRDTVERAIASKAR